MINQIKKQLETSFTNVNKKTAIDKVCAKTATLLTCSAAVSDDCFDAFMDCLDNLIYSQYNKLMSYEPEKKEEEHKDN